MTLSSFADIPLPSFSVRWLMERHFLITRHFKMLLRLESVVL